MTIISFIAIISWTIYHPAKVIIVTGLPLPFFYTQLHTISFLFYITIIQLQCLKQVGLGCQHRWPTATHVMGLDFTLTGCIDVHQAQVCCIHSPLMVSGQCVGVHVQRNSGVQHSKYRGVNKPHKHGSDKGCDTSGDVTQSYTV